MKKMKMHITHGELNLFEVASIPRGAKRIYPTNDQITRCGFILANSEQTGNHHCIETEGVEFYEHEGTLYLKVTGDTKLSCVDEKRHDTILVPRTTWKRKIKKEVDHLEHVKRLTAD